MTLAGASGQVVTVNFASADGSASALPVFAGSDYASNSGTLTFNPGETSKTIDVTVNPDTISESNETFTVELSSAVNAAIAVSPGTGTILNDDAVPSISIGDVSQAEGNAGFNNAIFFPVTLSAPSGQTVSVTFTTADGSALAGSDYTARSFVLTFNPGFVTQNVFVQVLGDTVTEPTETFVGNLTLPTNATLLDAQGTASLVNDD